ncbi:hypothetical protein [Lysinibacillus capsici]|uniref:hypothetical protein n=1 Tax=Lysinibacillus capsici TaxID=2115968 RepID=UPI000E1FFA6D|nr:hypothetical protein [Lysinibacillus capsici]RDV25317.1 hypothetical protein C7B89_22800 [Lysinibacillus capsici]
MAKYKVIHEFRDLQDEDHIYNVGDKYPRKGRIVKPRVEELISSDNKIGVPLIMEVSGEGDK